MGTLYVVATPIGNLEDVTERALRVLREVDLIAAEDTRHTRKLLTRFGIVTPTTSYFEHNKLAKLDYLLEKLRVADVALVSDAGTPGISDPGYELIRAALDASHGVVPIPGPSAIVSALSVSGLPTDQFVYVGFLPRRASERRRLFASLVGERRTMVAYEAPHRLVGALADLLEMLGDRRIAVCSDLTKLFEDVRRGTVSEMLEHYRDVEPRGEFTLVVGGAPEKAPMPEEGVRRQIDELVRSGASAREIAHQLTESTGWTRREIYRLALDAIEAAGTKGRGAER